MKLLLAFVVIAGFLLPAYGWGQRTAHPLAAKPETKQARYARLDQYAQHLPEAQAATLEKLAASLASQARTDDDKARLIFAWLAYHIAYDAAYLKGNTTHLYTPEAVFSSRKAICQGYADLFTDLATRMKLEAHTVSGYARDWLTFDNMFDKANAHAWNAYRIVGTWHLADATWGAGGLSFGDEEFEQKFNPFWFDVSPEQAIFYHLPGDATWQLLPTSVTPTVYQNWPYIKPDWFQLISGASLIRAFGAAKGSVKSLPTVEAETTKVVSPVQIVQVPLQGELVAGRPVRFVFQAPAEVRLSIDLYDKLLVLQSDGRYQQATVTPAVDRLRVSAWNKADSTTIFSLEYEVIPAPRQRKLQPGEHRKVAADSIVYLRR